MMSRVKYSSHQWPHAKKVLLKQPHIPLWISETENVSYLDAIQIRDHWATGHILTIWILDKSIIQIPTVFRSWSYFSVSGYPGRGSCQWRTSGTGIRRTSGSRLRHTSSSGLHRTRIPGQHWPTRPCSTAAACLWPSCPCSTAAAYQATEAFTAASNEHSISEKSQFKKNSSTTCHCYFEEEGNK